MLRCGVKKRVECTETGLEKGPPLIEGEDRNSGLIQLYFENPDWNSFTGPGILVIETILPGERINDPQKGMST